MGECGNQAMSHSRGVEGGGLGKWLSERHWFCLWDVFVVSWWETSCNKAQTWIRGTCANKPVVALILAHSAIKVYLRVYFKRLNKRNREATFLFNLEQHGPDVG